MWAVLFWLNLIAARRQSVAEIVYEHWAQYGRNVYSRYDYEALPTVDAHAVMQHLLGSFSALVGATFGSYTVKHCDDFSYTDPVDGSVSTGQGIRVLFSDGSRIIVRLSGTGTEGATLRIYLEAYDANVANHHLDAQIALNELIQVALQITQLKQLTGRDQPTVIT